jgi:hypothetical protein
VCGSFFTADLSRAQWLEGGCGKIVAVTLLANQVIGVGGVRNQAAQVIGLSASQAWICSPGLGRNLSPEGGTTNWSRPLAPTGQVHHADFSRPPADNESAMGASLRSC